eukprot:2136691-Rhodomonas_salina.3
MAALPPPLPPLPPPSAPPPPRRPPYPWPPGPAPAGGRTRRTTACTCHCKPQSRAIANLSHVPSPLSATCHDPLQCRTWTDFRAQCPTWVVPWHGTQFAWAGRRRERRKREGGGGSEGGGREEEGGDVMASRR